MFFEILAWTWTLFLCLRESCVMCKSTLSFDAVISALKLLAHVFTAHVTAP